MPGLLDDFAVAVDNRKRQLMNTVRGLLSDPAMQLAQMQSTPDERWARQYDMAAQQSVMPQVAEPAQRAWLEGVANAGGLLGIAKPTYQGGHAPPLRDSGSPLHDLTGTYPDDVYSHVAAQYYGHYGQGHPQDVQSFSLAHSLRGKPDAKVTIYRAVPHEPDAQEQLATLEKQMAAYMRRGALPDDAAGLRPSAWYDRAYAKREQLRSAPPAQSEKVDINPGDWVTINRDYAKEHGESALNGQYKIIKKTVRAKDIFTNGDSIHEWGYDPQP